MAQEKIRWIGAFSDPSYANDLEGELFLGLEDARQKLEERYRHGYWRRCRRIAAPDGEQTADLMPAVSEQSIIQLWKIVPETLEGYRERMKDDDAEPHYLPTDGTEPDRVVVIGERSQNAVAYSVDEWLSREQRRDERREREHAGQEPLI